MSEEKKNQESQAPLEPIEERQIDFYGDAITAALVKPNDQAAPEVYVPVKPICDYLGISWVGQRERIMRDPVLSEVLKGIRVTRIPLPKVGGGTQEALCLPLEFLPGWLFGVQANRVKVELRDKIIRYQRECFKVLSQAFSDETIDLVNDLGIEIEDEDKDIFAPPSHPPTAAELEMEARFEEVMRELAQTRELGLTIARMSEQQMEVERQLRANTNQINQNTARLDAASRIVGGLQRRVTALESRLDPEGLITQEQSVQISTMVKALAEYLTGRDASNPALPKGGPRPNRYQSIFAELYRRFGVPNYQVISLDRYPAVLKFLDDWKQAADLGQEDLFLQGKLL